MTHHPSSDISHSYPAVAATDSAAAEALVRERHRQRDTLTMIASENHVSEAVLEAQSSELTNKYAEGYPGERYYAGCEHADSIEQLAIDRARKLWGAEHVNVQPHSGTQANQAVYLATLDPGDRILSLKLSHGGHLSHGHPANFTGQQYEVEHYHVDPETGYIDYEELEEKAAAFDPDIVISGSSAYPRHIDFDRIQESADTADALHLADIAHTTGLIAAGEHPSPVGSADFITGSTHKTIRAGRGGIIMCREEYADAIDTAVFPGSQGGPLLHNIAGKAVGFGEALTPEFRAYAAQVVRNAATLADRLHKHGLKLVSNGTDKHLVLVDLRDSHPDLTGQDAEAALESVGLILNKNTVPGESRSPFVTSGIRIGTPALTTRGFETGAIESVADGIARLLDAPTDESVRNSVAETVRELCEQYPVYHQAHSVHAAGDNDD